MVGIYADRVLLVLGSAHTFPHNWYKVPASPLVHFPCTFRRLSIGVEFGTHCCTVSGWSLSLGSGVHR